MTPKLDIETVTRQHFAKIHRAALVLTGNPWDADDLAQETFLAIAGKLDQFEGRSNIYTYLYGILLNLDRRERRRLATRRRKLQIVWDNSARDEKATPPAETPIEVDEWKNSLWSFVSELPDGQRQVMVLRFSEGLQYDEIAEILECPLGTVKSRMFNGLAALRRLFEERGKSPSQMFPTEDVNYAI